MALKSLFLFHSHNPKLKLEPTELCSKARPLPKSERNLIQAQNSEPSFGKSRRALMVASIAVSSGLINGQSASGVDFGIMVPDQTLEEAESGIRGHAETMLQVKALIDSESWKEARSFLRTSASYVKHDFYTIIQNSPPNGRLQLRKLYFELFNNVTKLDFAARDMDTSRVLQCYDNITVALNNILSRI